MRAQRKAPNRLLESPSGFRQLGLKVGRDMILTLHGSQIDAAADKIHDRITYPTFPTLCVDVVVFAKHYIEDTCQPG